MTPTRSSVVPRLQWIRGMCSDQEPHHLIDAKIAEVIELLLDERDARRQDELRTVAERLMDGR